MLTGQSPIDAAYAIKIPKGTVIYDGPVGYQGGAFVGGQNNLQIFVEKPWNISGAQVVREIPLP